MVIQYKQFLRAINGPHWRRFLPQSMLSIFSLFHSKLAMGSFLKAFLNQYHFYNHYKPVFRPNFGSKKLPEGLEELLIGLISFRFLIGKIVLITFPFQ